MNQDTRDELRGLYDEVMDMRMGYAAMLGRQLPPWYYDPGVVWLHIMALGGEYTPPDEAELDALAGIVDWVRTANPEDPPFPAALAWVDKAVKR